MPFWKFLSSLNLFSGTERLQLGCLGAFSSPSLNNPNCLSLFSCGRCSIRLIICMSLLWTLDTRTLLGVSGVIYPVSCLLEAIPSGQTGKFSLFTSWLNFPYLLRKQHFFLRMDVECLQGWISPCTTPDSHSSVLQTSPWAGGARLQPPLWR